MEKVSDTVGFAMKARIGGMVDISTIDYPHKLCSVIFFCGCPFRCPFCQNWKLFFEENCEGVEIGEVLLNLRSNAIIEAVTVTGGEPTLQNRALVELLRGVGSLGLARKIDTCGFYPRRIRRLVADGLLDYVAMDVKAPLQPGIYGEVAGLPEEGQKIVERVRESLTILSESDLTVEIRTTIVPGLVDESWHVERIAEEIQGFDVYVLQQFRSHEGTLDPKFRDLPYPSRERVLELAKRAKLYLPDVRIRTVEKGEEQVSPV